MPKPPHCIYVIADSNGWLKIGITMNLARRLQQLQHANAEPLFLVASLTLTKIRADVAERHAHSLLKHAERRGEWFKTDRKSAIAAITQSANLLVSEDAGKSGMTGAKFTQMLQALNLTDVSAARVLGISLDRIEGFKAGVRVPRHISKLIRFMVKYGIHGDRNAIEPTLVTARKTLPPFGKIVRFGYN